MTSAIWIAVSIILLIGSMIALFVLIARRQALLTHKRLQAAFDGLVATHALSILDKDFLLRKIIAIDGRRALLAFVDCSGDSDRVEVIDLATVAGCRIVHPNRGTALSGEEANGQFGLQVALKDRQELYLPFYDEMSDGVHERPSLSAKAEKWCSILKANALHTSNKK